MANMKKADMAKNNDKIPAYQSPIRLFIIMSISIIFAEALIMFGFQFFPTVSENTKVILDTFLLFVILFPIIYLFVYRPLILLITNRTQDNEKIKMFFAVFEHNINTVFITDIKGNIEFVNPMFEKVTGYSREEVVGQSPSMLDSGETAEVVFEELLKTVRTGKTWRGMFKNKKKDGQFYWCESIISPIRNEEGQITHFLSIQEDVTEKMKLKEDANLLTSYASFDGLTGLYNRTRFMELLEGWIIQAKARNYTGAILLIDIDRFRLINDTYGNKAGDELLKRMAEYLKDVTSDIDIQYFRTFGKEIMESILCRMGGDEFAVFLPSRNEKETLETADEIRRSLESFQFENWAGHITVSVGIVLYPAHGATLYDLFKKVDAAVFSAKELGRNRSRLYQDEDLVLEKMHSRVEWKGRIQNALREDRFVPWFQPLLDLKNDTIYHYEALVRMRNENGEIVPPGAFIDTAEAVGIIRDIDKVVITKAMRLQAMLKKQGRRVCFSMNLSGKDLGEKELLDFLKDSMCETSSDPECLNFEITETAAVHDLNRAVRFIRDLRALGCKFSLDDFGVGFTSFKYLKEMEVDYIKIDGSFIRKLAESKSDRLFVKAMVDVAHGLGVRTVAEFVENKETVRILKDYGVDYAQGYFIGKPATEVLPEDYKPIEPV